MASNLQKLRAKRAANRKKENELTSSFNIEEGVSIGELAENTIEDMADTKENAIEDIADTKENTPLPEASNQQSESGNDEQNGDNSETNAGVGTETHTGVNPEMSAEKPSGTNVDTPSNTIADTPTSSMSISDIITSREMDSAITATGKNSLENDENTIHTDSPITPINNINNSNSINPINDNPSSNAAEPERNLGLRLSTNEDKRYLDLAPLSRSMTKKAFFIELMEHEFEATTTININDPEVETFRNSSLKTTAMTISVPESLIAKIKEYSARHLMKYQRYVAYVVYKARMNDDWWQEMQG